MNRKLLRSTLTLVLLSSFFHAFAQKDTPKKYPSVFWEISGNGLKKPSYLFGTMHVSSKLAFHLSDSFYNAVQNVDAVALELNTDTWQGNMVNVNQLKENYNRYIQAAGNDYLNENSFRINKYEDELKTALSTQPAVLNNLLYRSYKTKEDFEEDTFLDLYIYQTGKKLGKRSTGVEDYFETERLILEAYADMANEKSKKIIDTDGESMRDINEKIQDAYKRGDLDLMDSLSILTERSAAFNEKFLYRRNEIQAASMDTIMKKSSLFVGVGAAHLPGKRGVIELLRKMGYNLRPIKMTSREASKKEAIDKLKVPVNFSAITAEDGFYKAEMPGTFYKVSEDYTRSDRRQYADMANGCYYQVTRVKTHAALFSQTEEQVKRKLDSLLYENIPGKIIKKTAIVKNGYDGYDITNKTRRGDLQRYQIFITPTEIIIFKMSGKENYIEGREGNQFFSSIILKEADTIAKTFTPEQGGFTVRFPQTPAVYNNSNLSDGINRWEYEAIDKATGDVYCIFKKSVYNFKFLEEDSFDLKLVEESFRSPDYFEYQLQRKAGSFKGYPSLDVKEKLKDSSVLTVKYIIKGPHYYVLAVKSKVNNTAEAFFNSFSFASYRYNPPKLFTDTFLHFTVTTPIQPLLDEKYRTTAEKAVQDIAEANSSENTYWPKNRNAVFSDDTTGEMVLVSVQKYPAYYYVKDSSKFWQNEINDSYEESDLILKDKTWFEKSNDIKGYRFNLRDTGSSRVIQKMLLLKGNYLFNLSCMGDTLNHQSSFINNFLSSFTTEQQLPGKNIFKNTLDSFFTNLFSSDSSTRVKTRRLISNIYYGEKGIPKIMNAISRLSPTDKDYVETKSKLIAELGYIKDTSRPVVVEHLKQLYKSVGDTSLFQNEILEALARHKTLTATQAFKELVLQDPPVFDNDYAYSNLFEHFNDSLLLAKVLFPEFLQLTTLEDYKDPVNDLLAELVDSGLVKGPEYQEYFNKIYFDARIELKKQMGKDEKTMQEDRMKNEDYSNDVRYNDDNKETLSVYALLIAPFYEQNNTVPRFFDKLLLSKNNDVRLAAVTTLLKNNHPVPDSILQSLANNDQLRGKLYSELVAIKKEGLFPNKYKTQLDLARSYLVQQKNYASIDSVIFISKQTATYKNEKGMVYFFKYRVKKEADWKIGISGLQPLKLTALSSNHDLTSMTDKKLKEDKPANEQFQEQLKRLLFLSHKSAKNFYSNEQYNYRYFNED